MPLASSTTSIPAHWRIGHRALFAGLALLLLVLTYLSLALGYRLYSPAEIWAALTAFDGSETHVVIRDLRLPRAVMAPMVGAALGIAGVIVQTLSRNRIASPDHMLDASLDEMCALVAGKDGPSADELADRASFRATYTAKDVPPFLGPPAPPPPDISDLPPGPRRLMRAMGTALGHLFGSSPAANEESVLYGLAASKGVYEGPARRVAGPPEFGRIAKGDVLITESTSEAFNILLPLLGGIVTDNGGLLSHAAIVSREYGIPGVVGTREATERIADGVRVRVDGDAGEVTVLG